MENLYRLIDNIERDTERITDLIIKWIKLKPKRLCMHCRKQFETEGVEDLICPLCGADRSICNKEMITLLNTNASILEMYHKQMRKLILY